MFLPVFFAPNRGDGNNKAGVISGNSRPTLEEAMNDCATTVANNPKVQWTFFIIDTTTGQVVKQSATVVLDWK